EHVVLVAREGELAVFHDQPAHRADDFEAIRAGRFTGGTEENTRRAVRPLQVSRHAVLDFDLVKAPQLAEAAHAFGHADEPLHRVEIVQALVEQHAAAFALPRRPPAAARVIRLGAIPVTVDPVHAHNFAEVALSNQLL